MVVVYTGIGSDDLGIYSDKEFLNVMISTFVNRNWNLNEHQDLLKIIKKRNPNRNLPDEFDSFTIDDWIEFSGASRTIKLPKNFSLEPEVDYSDPFN